MSSTFQGHELAKLQTVGDAPGLAVIFIAAVATRGNAGASMYICGNAGGSNSGRPVIHIDSKL